MLRFAPGLFGWMVASFLTTLFVGTVLAFMGGVAAMAWSFFAITAAFAIGGYLSARLAARRGALHGLAVGAWTVAFTILGALIANPAFGLMLSPFAIHWSAVTARSATGLVVIAALMFAGAAGGGALANGFDFGKFKTARGSSSRGMHQ